MISLNRLKTDRCWAFNEIKRSETLYASHGYHRYPAKFIPQLVQKLIQEYTKENDLILDPFGGCGTTLVEALLSGRNCIGIDINDVAVLIAKVKANKIKTKTLESKNRELLEKINNCSLQGDYYKSAHPRLQYWFRKGEYNKLVNLYKCIEKEKNSKIKSFYKCCFSNILKKCSIWYSKSIKPMRDTKKIIIDPVEAFSRHLKFMTKKNEEFEMLLDRGENKANHAKMIKGDARKLKLKDSCVDLIVTSPPYVISYEYADLHQLSTLWFGFSDDINKIKKDFVGTSSRNTFSGSWASVTAEKTINRLKKKTCRLAKNISNYYSDLDKCYSEMSRVLKKGKYACLVLGDTEYMGIKISNIVITIEMLNKHGFKLKKIIKRKLSSKIFTSYRDKDNGKFVSVKDPNKKRVYQYEYIIISQKLK